MFKCSNLSKIFQTENVFKFNSSLNPKKSSSAWIFEHFVIIWIVSNSLKKCLINLWASCIIVYNIIKVKGHNCFYSLNLYFDIFYTSIPIKYCTPTGTSFGTLYGAVIGNV